MSAITRFELRRAFGSWGFKATFAAALALSAAQLVSVPLQYATSDLWSTWRSGVQTMPPNVWSSWLGATSYSTWSVLYYYLMPLLCCAPHGSSLCFDIRSGYITELVTRVPSSSYLRAKALSTCLSATVIAVVPQLLNLLGTMMLVPMLEPDPAAGIYAVTSVSALAQLFYTHPVWYFMLYMALDAAVASLLSCLSLVLAFAIRQRFLVLTLPFLASIVSGFLLFSFGLACYAPASLMEPYQSMPGLNMPVAVLLLVGCAFVLAVVFNRKSDGFDAL